MKRLPEIDWNKVNVLKDLPDEIVAEHMEDPIAFAARRVATMRQMMRNMATKRRRIYCER